MTPEQHRSLVANLTAWRRNRLIVAGKKPPYGLDSATQSQLARDYIALGTAAYNVTWTQRPKTATELEWELFPRPGLVWAPTLRRVEVVLDSDGRMS